MGVIRPPWISEDWFLKCPFNYCDHFGDKESLALVCRICREVPSFIDDGTPLSEIYRLRYVPLVFASSIFVPIQTMPGPLEGFAEINPITLTADAVRALSQGGNFEEPLLGSLFWILLILVVFIPIAINRYRKSV